MRGLIILTCSQWLNYEDCRWTWSRNLAIVLIFSTSFYKLEHIVIISGVNRLINPLSPRLAKTVHFVILLCLTKHQTILLVKGEPLGGKGLIIFLEQCIITMQTFLTYKIIFYFYSICLTLHGNYLVQCLHLCTFFCRT